MDDAGLEAAHDAGEGDGIGKGGAGHFQRNPGGKRQGTGNCQQDATRAQVEGSSKFQEFLALVVTAADEDRNG